MVFLAAHYHYKSEEIRVLVDDGKDPRQQPTRRNILEAMHELVRGACPHDSLFFHCVYCAFPLAQHHFSYFSFAQTRVMGARFRTGMGTRSMGWMKVRPSMILLESCLTSELVDAVIFPVDFKSTGVIVDDVCGATILTSLSDD